MILEALLTPTIFVAAQIVQIALLVVLVVVDIGLMQLVADINRRLGPDTGPLVRIGGLEKGVRAAEIDAHEMRTGERATLDALGGRTGGVLFLSPGCDVCTYLADAVNKLTTEPSGPPFIVLLRPGRGTDPTTKLDRRVVVVADSDNAIAKAYEVRKTPILFVVGADRTIVHKATPNNLVGLQDAFAGFGYTQTRDWEPRNPTDDV